MGYRKAWASRIETQQTAKKKVLLLVIAIFVTRIVYDVNFNKSDCIDKKIAILNWKKCRLRDPNFATVQFIFKKKK